MPAPEKSGSTPKGPQKPDAANDVARSFFNGAAERRRRLEQKRADAEAKERAEAERRHTEDLGERRTREKAFPDYYRTLAPFLDMLKNLPPQDGCVFHVVVQLTDNKADWETTRHGPQALIAIAYAGIVDKSVDLPQFNMRLRPGRGEGRVDTWRSRSADKTDSKQQDGDAATSEWNIHPNIAEAIGMLGAWVSEVAPDRMDEIRRKLDVPPVEALQQDTVLPPQLKIQPPRK